VTVLAILLLIRLFEIMWRLVKELVILLGHQTWWSYGLQRRSEASWLLEVRVQIPLLAWIFFSLAGCVGAGDGFCDRLNTSSLESCRVHV